MPPGAYGSTCGTDRSKVADLAVIVLPPISTAHLKAADVEELTRTTREKMLVELVALTESPLGRKATKANVEAREEDLASVTTAMASGRER